jgi:hypothetical protein
MWRNHHTLLQLRSDERALTLPAPVTPLFKFALSMLDFGLG